MADSVLPTDTWLCELAAQVAAARKRVAVAPPHDLPAALIALDEAREELHAYIVKHRAKPTG